MSSVSRSQSKIRALPTHRPELTAQERDHPELGSTSYNLRTVLNKALSERLQKLMRQMTKARSRPTEKTVHDLRVAIRRMIAMLELVRTIMPKSGGSKMKKQLKTHLRSLSTLRDTQVQILLVQRLLENYEMLSGLLNSLKAREIIESKHARKEIERMDPDRIKKNFEGLTAKLDSFLSVHTVRESAESILWGMLAAIFIRTVVLRSEIRNDTRDRIEKIHELRLLFKKFRYTVEILQPLFSGVSEQLLQRMSEYQTKMGTIQDTEVLTHSVDSFVRRARRKQFKRSTASPGRFDLLQEQLSTRLERELESFLKTMDEIDEYWEIIAQVPKTKSRIQIRPQNAGS